MLACRSVLVEDGAGGSGGAAGSVASTTQSAIASSNVASSAASTAQTSTSSGDMCPFDPQPESIPVPDTGPCSGAYNAYYACLPAPVPPETCETTYTNECVLQQYQCGLQWHADAACGPDPSTSECCYIVVGGCPVGRPFIVEGSARIAALEEGDGWARSASIAGSPDVSALDETTRAALAAFWAEEGLYEHASIASFARFVLQLLSVGAPADLVERAQRAQTEELEHARVCFSMASAYAGKSSRPGRLDLSRGLDAAFDPVAIAVAVASEGCIAETVAALQIAAARDVATDECVRRALTVLAEQESEHAMLSWRYLRWALERGDARLREEVAQVFEHPGLHVGLGAMAMPADSELLRAHGCLGIEQRRALASDALAEVVIPSARALFAAMQPLERKDQPMGDEPSPIGRVDQGRGRAGGDGRQRSFGELSSQRPQTPSSS